MEEQRIFEMRIPHALLGTLTIIDVDMPWFSCAWEPTGAFTELEPLFWEARRLCVEDQSIPNKGVQMMDEVIENAQIFIRELGEEPRFKEPLCQCMIWLTEEGTMNFSPG